MQEKGESIPNVFVAPSTEVAVEEINSGRNRLLLMPRISADHQYPEIPSQANAQISPMMSPVWKFPYTADTLFSQNVDVGSSGSLEIETSSTKNNEWPLPASLPRPVVEIIKRALAHEAQIDPDLRQKVANISIRMQQGGIIERYWKKSSVSSPHVDAKGENASIYTLSTAPTTVQYPGKPKETTPSSLLPLTLYRSTSDVMHSQPWEESWDELLDDGQKRFFIRIIFRPYRSHVKKGVARTSR